MRNSSLRLLAIFVALAVICFLTTTFFIRHRATIIDKAAYGITNNATPSIRHLSSARSLDKELEHKLRHLLEEAEQGLFLPTAELKALLWRIHQEVHQHEQTPDFPGEHVRNQELDRALIRLDDELEHFTLLFQGHHLEEAKRLNQTELRTSFNEMIDAIDDTIDINVQAAHDLAEQIRVLRRQVANTALILNTLSLLWTFCLVAVLIHGIRRSALREAEYRLTKDRAMELEQFAGRVAHDILNPLSVVSYGLVGLDLTRLDEMQAKLVTRGRASVKRIQQILDGLLKFACAGAHPEPGARADARQVLFELEPELRAQAAAVGAELTVELCAESVVACSPGILSSLLCNLAHNAIKYIGEGAERHIMIRVLDRQKLLRFEVEDTGPGLPPGLEQLVFEPYVRAHAGHQPGFGLGLATVKKAAEAHGGRVGVRSQVGRGCLFFFELPRQVPPRPN